MALIKEIELGNTGVVPTYWRIVGVELDQLTHKILIRVGGYVSKEARLAGKDNIGELNIQVNERVGANLPGVEEISVKKMLLADNLLGTLYATLKFEAPQLHDAQDDV